VAPIYRGWWFISTTIRWRHHTLYGRWSRPGPETWNYYFMLWASIWS
jgi:hypothetical protein